MIEPVRLTTLLGLGFVLGLKHALDADHVVAVSTIVSQGTGVKKSSLIGAIWGVGHTTALFLVGAVILIFKLVIPDRIALSFEFLVGLVLMILGIDVLRKIIRERRHFHKHSHNNITHTHFHSHKASPTHNHLHKSFAVGVVHGLAGSAALMLLVLTTVKSILPGLLYIVIFGAGTIVGMLLVSGVMGLSFLLTAKFNRINEAFKILSGTISIFLGVIIIYGIIS